MNPDLSSIILAVSTIVLAWATVNLARYTRGLSQLTQRLVNIETLRDNRDASERRVLALQRSLAASVVVHQINPAWLAKQLTSRVKLPLKEMEAIETLHSLKAYLDDSDINPHLDFLCSVFDTARLEPDTKMHANVIAERVRTVQFKLQRFIDNARREIAETQKTESTHTY